MENYVKPPNKRSKCACFKPLLGSKFGNKCNVILKFEVILLFIPVV